MGFQEALVLLIVLAAVCYLGRRFYRKLSGRERPSCCEPGNSCEGCSGAAGIPANGACTPQGGGGRSPVEGE